MRSKISGVAVAGSTVISPVRRTALPAATRSRVRNAPLRRSPSTICIEESELLRLRGIDRARGEDELERLLDTDQSRHALRAAGARNDAERDFRHPEARARRRHAVVAGERDLESTAHDGAMHGGDDGTGRPRSR